MDGGTNYFLYFAVISANLVSFSIGTAYSWTSPVLPKLQNNLTNPLGKTTTTLEDSWITSLLSLGAASGPFLAGMVSEKVGRKNTLLIFAAPMLASHLICAFGRRLGLYLVARFLLGVGTGCCLAVLPNFVAEIAEDGNRGLMGCVMGVMIALGSLYTYVMGPFVSIKVFSVCNLVPLVLFYLTFGVSVPESPYYSVSGGDKIKAERSLVKFRRALPSVIEKELLLVVETVEYSKSNKRCMKDICKSKGLMRGVTIGVGLMFFQQLSGICAILGYMQAIFHATGTALPPHIAVMVIATIAIVAVVITTQLVDMLGRRVLLIVSLAGCFVSLSTLGLYFHLKSKGFNVDPINWLPIACLIVYILTYNLALGPLPWTIMGELFPPNVKSSASSLCASACLVLAFLITMFFPTVSERLGLAGCFWLFASSCALGLIFVVLLVPETKGKSLQDIQELLNAG